uniref:Polygalacturonase n=1 Tax=Kalanchoe fedtschenkoi TaxID=63787 RepID=A0A7N0U8C1_KALFE
MSYLFRNEAPDHDELVLFISAAALCHRVAYAAVQDVTQHGAVGDGSTNDAWNLPGFHRFLDPQAFEKAWDEACNADESSTLLIPAGKTFLVHPLSFNGPCKASKVEIQVLGNVVAPTDKDAWGHCTNWITIQKIDNLAVSGTGGFNAQGDNWWHGPLKKACKHPPTSLHFDGCNGLTISGIHSKDSPKNHFIARCNNVTVSNIEITAPEKSPNTDGIDVSSSTDVHVRDSQIGTGDDCIAINNQCSNIQITGVHCGPGHGISVGSLGKNGADVAVEHILVQHCTLTGTENGARIKTCGYARNITYKNITLDDVNNPIIINQHYEGKHDSLLGQDTALEISNVTFSGFTGTSHDNHAITLDCTPEGQGCTGLVIEDVTITTASGGTPEASCTNAHGTARNTSPPVGCLSEGQPFFDRGRLW